MFCIFWVIFAISTPQITIDRNGILGRNSRLLRQRSQLTFGCYERFVLSCMGHIWIMTRFLHLLWQTIFTKAQRQTAVTTYLKTKQSLLFVFTLRSTAMQRQKAVAAYFLSKQLLPFTLKGRVVLVSLMTWHLSRVYIGWSWQSYICRTVVRGTEGAERQRVDIKPAIWISLQVTGADKAPMSASG